MNRIETSAWRARAITAVLLLVVFASGAVVGGGLLRWLGRPPGPPRPGTLGPPLSEIGLSAEQEKRALAVIQRHKPEIEAILLDLRPRIRAINKRVEAKIRTFLTAEQARELDRLKPLRRPPPLPPRPGAAEQHK